MRARHLKSANGALLTLDDIGIRIPEFTSLPTAGNENKNWMLAKSGLLYYSNGSVIRPIPSLPVDPNADGIVFWDDSAGNWAYLTPSSQLAITNTTLGIGTLPLNDLSDVEITSAAEGNQLVRDATQFINRPAGTLLKARYTELVDDFDGGSTTAGNIGRRGWTQGGTAGSSVAALVSEQFHPGIYRFTTVATSNGQVICSPPTSTYLNDWDEVEFVFRINSITQVQHACWLTDNSGITTNSLGLMYQNGINSGKWIIYKLVGGVNTITDTGITAVAGQWTYVLFKRTGSGAFDCTITHNGSTFTGGVSGVTVSTGWFEMIRSVTTENVAKTIDWDYCRITTGPFARV